MINSSAEQIRAWRGPVLLSFGFRPFFLLGGIWAVLAMAVWLAMLAGRDPIATNFDPVSWHAHEFLFGYLGAVVAGFLLTAVPNWSGRLPIVGWRLGGLVALWLLGRAAVAFSAHLPPLFVALIDLSCLGVLAAMIVREVFAGRHWRSLIILALLCVLIASNAFFHLEAAQSGSASAGLGLRLGLAGSIMLIIVIGGRIVPSFTRNWLAKTGVGRLPTVFGHLDKASFLIGALALALWVAAPSWPGSGVTLLLAGLLHAMRLAYWGGFWTGREPLVWILHIGYLFVPLGAFAMGLAILAPDSIEGVAAQHLWTAGAIGVMTLAVMTRAILGHTGRTLTAGIGTVAIYIAIIGAVVARFIAGFTEEFIQPLYLASGLLWVAAFLGFTLLYGPMLLKPKQRSEPSRMTDSN